MRKAFLYWAAVMELAGMVVGGVLIGRWLDEKIGSGGSLTGILAFAGFAAGIWQMMKIVRKINGGKTS